MMATWREPQPRVANGQAPQTQSSGMLRNHWSPGHSDLVVYKDDDEDENYDDDADNEDDDDENDDDDAYDDDEEPTSLVVWQKTKTRPIEKSRVAITWMNHDHDGTV